MGTWFHFLLKRHKHSSLLSHSMQLLNWLEERKNPRGVPSIITWLHDIMTWQMRLLFLYGCHAVELISPESPNGNSHIGSINILVGGRRRHRVTCLLQGLAKNDPWVLSTSHFLKRNYLQNPKNLNKEAAALEAAATALPCALCLVQDPRAPVFFPSIWGRSIYTAFLIWAELMYEKICQV